MKKWKLKKMVGPKVQCNDWGCFSVLCNVKCYADMTMWWGVFFVSAGNALTHTCVNRSRSTT